MNLSNVQTSQLPIKLAITDAGNSDHGLGMLYPLIEVLKRNFDIELTSLEDADVLFYGDFGVRHHDFKGIKVFFTGENHQAYWNACDYAFTHELKDSNRHMRMPYYAHVLLNDPASLSLLQSRPMITHEDLERHPRKFCNFVYRNHVGSVRNRFFEKLSKYKHIDSAGPFLNNMNGYMVPKGFQNNRIFASQYKFTISFENESHLGYTTEKITHPLLGRSVPIYWGDKNVVEDFNSKSFINYFDFDSEDDLIDFIIQVDQDDDLLLQYLNAPCFESGLSPYLDEQRYMKRFEEIFHQRTIRRTGTQQFFFKLGRYVGRPAFDRYRAYRRIKRDRVK